MAGARAGADGDGGDSGGGGGGGDEQEAEAQRGGVRGWLGGSWKWLLGAVGAALAGLIATIVTGAWPWLDDLRKDLTEEDPVRVVASTRLWPGDTGAFAEPLTGGPDRFQLLRGSTREQWQELLRRHRVAQVGYQNLLIVIQGRRNAPVRIIEVRPRVLAEGPVLRGTCVHVPTQGGTEPHEIKVDLDHPHPGHGRKDRPATFLPKSVDLAAGGRTTVQMTVLAKRRSYEYDLEITYDYGDGADFRTTHVRQPNGDPFRVTGEARRYRVAYTDPSIANAYREAGRNRSC